jgi:hypothetical protein
MFFKTKKNNTAEKLDGVITFFGSTHALRSESVLKKNDKKVRLVPGPREISPNCGVALRFDYSEKEDITALLSENSVSYENIHFYPEKEL